MLILVINLWLKFHGNPFGSFCVKHPSVNPNLHIDIRFFGTMYDGHKHNPCFNIVGSIPVDIPSSNKEH